MSSNSDHIMIDETTTPHDEHVTSSHMSEEDTVMSLPLSKIKKIFKMDPDYAGSSASAVYATGAATELFVQYLVEQASMNAKAEKRKKIQYRDLSSAVSSQESLYFLTDTIPKTQPVEKALKEKRINVSEEDRAKHRDIIGEDADDGNDEPSGAAAAAAGASSTASKEHEKTHVLSKGQSTLPFQTVTSASAAGNPKKAVLSDLIVADEDSQTDADAMVVD